MEPGRDALLPEGLIHWVESDATKALPNSSVGEQHPTTASTTSCPNAMHGSSQHRSSNNIGSSTKLGRDEIGEGSPLATEHSPLLRNGSMHSSTADPEHKEPLHVTWQQETKIIAAYSAPLILTFLLQYSITVTSVFAVGRLGQIELGAVSLANMSAAITCLTPFQGLATSLDTLCAQAFGSVLWVFSAHIFYRIVPNPESAVLAGLYLKVMAFGIPGIAFFETGKRFLQAQTLFRATTYLLLIGAPINVFLHWLLVWKLEMGFIGAPIAAAISTDLLPILLFLYVMRINGSQCWGGFTMRAFANWPSMLALALPAMLMVEVEWLAFELMTFLASRFGTEYLAAQSILSTLTSISYQIPFPLSIAASTRVAHLIGAGEVDAAKKTAKVAFGAICTVVLVNLLTYALLRQYLPLLFTNDKAVIKLAAAYLPLVAVVQVFDGISSGAHGLLRGIGKQYIGAPVNLIAYYAIALPIVCGLVFGLGWTLDGTWAGISMGLICVALFEYTYLVKANWRKAAEEAAARNAAG